MDETESMRRPESRYRWVIAGACFLMIFTALGFWQSPQWGCTFPPLRKIWESPAASSPSLTAAATSQRPLSTSFFGRLILKMGSRVMISLGFLSLIASCLLYSLADSVYLFYLGGCLLGLGLAWTTTTLVGYLVDRWFAERKGTVMGHHPGRQRTWRRRREPDHLTPHLWKPRRRMAVGLPAYCPSAGCCRRAGGTFHPATLRPAIPFIPFVPRKAPSPPPRGK